MYSGPLSDKMQVNMTNIDALRVQQLTSASVDPAGGNQMANIAHSATKEKFCSYINPSMLIIIGSLFIAYGLIAK